MAENTRTLTGQGASETPSTAIAGESSATNVGDTVKNAGQSSSRTQETARPAQEAEYSVVDFDRVTNEDIIIALMGPTGAGKSSFIASITNDNGEGVGHDLTSCTSDIKATKLKFKRFSVVLVDTPGFNDTKKSDLEILNLISDWLNPNCQSQSHSQIQSQSESQGHNQSQSQSSISTPILSAILYFHRITDNRMAGTPLKNLRVFEKLCGKDAMSKVILVTTMWDEVDTDTGNERLKELKDSYWKGMISRGSTTFKCEDARRSPIQLLRQILQQKEKRELTGGGKGDGLSLDNVLSFLKSQLLQLLKKEEEASVLLQKEISDMKLEIKETAAGQQLCSRLEELAQKRMETLGKIQEETKRADEKTAEDLWKEFNQIKDQLDSTLSQARQLKMNPATRWLRRSVGRFRVELRRNKHRSLQAGGQAKGHTEGKAEGHAEGQSERQAEGQSERQAEGQSERQAEGQSERQAEGQAKGHAEGKAERQAEGQSEGRD